MAHYVHEMEQEPFDPEEFVERLARKCTNLESNSENEGFDPNHLYDTLVQAVKDLKVLQELTEMKLDRLQMIVNEEKTRHYQTIAELQDKNKQSFTRFLDLDDRINFVATKVVHLGDQLESVNTPRSRTVEAQKLMKYFSEFLSPSPLLSDIFTERSQLDNAADVIHKLHLISQELPSGKFDDARHRIALKYDEIERSLVEEFVKAHRSYDKPRMKEIARILSHFKGYSQCVDAFIEQSQLGAFVGKDIFQDVIPLCEKNAPIIQEVFTNPDQVMIKFVLHIYNGRLQEYIQSNLISTADKENYLRILFDLYSKTNKLSTDLANFNMGTDNTFLTKLTKQIFHRHLKDYTSIETDYLKEKMTKSLQRYYESKSHQKKTIQSGGIYDLRRNIQVSLGTRANIHIGPSIDNYGGETFLSEEMAINLLQESKLALRRCQILSQQSEASENALLIFDILIHNLCAEHIFYATELGLQAIPVAEPKSELKIYFFDIVQQCNAIMHLLEKHFSDHLVPLVVFTSKHAECLQKKKEMIDQLEMKLDMGIDRTLSAIIGWIKLFLQSEQKKTDFKPTVKGDIVTTRPCTIVVKFLNSCVEKIRDCLDGKNVEVVLIELGTRFHRVIYDHLLQFQYSDNGAMVAICDINEYRKCIREFKIPLLNSLMDTLHALCNLLVVQPENLKQMCSETPLSDLNRSIIQTFVQLRIDYKTSKLGSYMKQ